VRVYISVDMEGVAGVVNVDQCRRAGSDYPLARKWMTGEANAAALGAFEAGAAKVLINDSHGDMANLLLDELDARVEVLSGSLKPRSMAAGVEQQFDVALFVGYHAGASSAAGVLDHTYYGRVVADVTVNDRRLSETGLNALVCGVHGTPVGLVTGDATTCAQAREQLGDVVTVEVKQALSRYAAKSLHPEAARAEIQAGARTACEERRRFTPFKLAAPLRLQVRVHNSAMADQAMLLPRTTRLDGVTLAYATDDPETLLDVLRAWTLLGASTIPA
jgi:D-amino peptidase